MIRPILQHPDPVLREVARPVLWEFDNGSLAKWIAVDLQETFDATKKCIGLAAIQLSMPFRVIMFDMSPSRQNTLIMFNPVITRAEDTQMVNDGCMSVEFGKKFAYTRRPKRIRVNWQSVTGGACSGKFSGTEAAIIHHEIDHLDGKLFIDLLGEGA